ncbi:MAG: hypothetical protein V2J24_15200 [Pseudomonadales bacterium]|jgi:hypothetical protein|nr:hypothetical protein [Pseudomonadales bacterium]
MFKPSDIIIDEYLARLREAFVAAHPGVEQRHLHVLDRAGRMALHHVARTNALYTNLESALLISEVSLRIVEGRQIERFDVSPVDWLHFMLGSLSVFVGFARGVVPGDDGRKLVVSPDGRTVELDRSQTDGCLLREYVERSQMFIRRRYADTPPIDPERLAGMIELARMPTPRTPPEDQESWPALLRAAQIIALGADPRFVQRSKKLYRQLEEVGLAAKMGYANPADVIDSYPQRFWKHLLPQITVALSYLKYTGGGQTWLARLNSRMLEEEHKGASV